MRRRGGRNHPGESQSGQGERQDGGKDASPAVTPVSADPPVPSMMDAHDSSKAIPGRGRPRAWARAAHLLPLWELLPSLRQLAVLPERHCFVVLLSH